MDKRIRFISVFLMITIQIFAQKPSESILWEVNNIESIHTHSTTVLGFPQVVESDLGPVVEFNGIDDGLIVDSNPVAGADGFTIEVVFKPYTSDDPDNVEQRFIHMQESDSRRLLIELRLTDDNQWFLDTFMKDGSSSKALYAVDFLHPIGDWYHAALVYENGIMRHYVDGIEEMSGDVDYQAMQSGQTSIGVRLNERSWYKGAIHSLCVTPSVLQPEDFQISTTDVEEVAISPVSFQLLQNYPNPFNPATEIRYQISGLSSVQLTVYNALGEEVSVLVDEVKQTGEHSIIWNASNQAAGVYFVQMVSQNSVQTQKILLLK